MQAGKYNHGHFKNDGTVHCIPTPLATAFESLMVGRQMLGEENDFLFARNLLEDLIAIWNQNVDQLRQDFSDFMRDRALASLEDEDDQNEAVQERISEQTKATLQDTMAEMKTIAIEKTPAAMKTLGITVLIVIWIG